VSATEAHVLSYLVFGIGMGMVNAPITNSAVSAMPPADATRPGWWIIAACGFAVIVLALITTGQRGRASAAKTATLVATAEEAAEKVPAALANASDTA
jgi:hypothetical protein